MSDRVFEWSLTALTMLCAAWMIAGIVLPVIGIPWIGTVWAILTGLMTLIFGGGTFLYFWGQNYMSRG